MKNYFKEFMEDNGLKNGDEIIITDATWHGQIITFYNSSVKFRKNVTSGEKLDILELLFCGHLKFKKREKYEKITLRRALINLKYDNIYIKLNNNYIKAKYCTLLAEPKYTCINLDGIDYSIKEFVERFNKFYEKVY